MNRLIPALLLLVSLAPLAAAKGRPSVPKTSTPRSAPRSATTKRTATRSTKCTSCARDTKGRIARSTTAKHDFQKSHPCPATGKTTGSCPGYVIDHVVPLKRGGADSPNNMQWQTKSAAAAKDKIE